jgi:dihydrofolate reductase
MARFVYFTATSLDGFIADENNSLDWLFEVALDPDDKSWDAFLAGIGAMVMGSTTYEWILAHDDLLAHPERWQGYYADRPCWVFTHRDLPAIPGVDLRFVRGDVGAAYDEIVAAAGDRDVWLVGGGDLVAQFDDAGHLDEVQLGFCPVFLGAGAPVLPRRITSQRLTLRDVRRSGQQVTLVLDVSRPG